MLFLAGSTALYAKRELVDSGRFADRLTSTLRDEHVRTLFGRRVTAAIEAGHPDLIALRPVLTSAAAGVAGSPPFQAALRAAAADLHASVFDRERATVTLTVADIGVLVVEALRHSQPEVARRISASAQASASSLATIHRAATNVAEPAKRLGPLGAAALVLAALAAGAALLLSSDRRRTAATAGLVLAAAGAVGAVALAVTRAVVLSNQPGGEPRAAAGAVWDAFLGGLSGWFLAALACGLVATAAAASWRGRRPSVDHAWELLRGTHAGSRVRALRAASLLALGILIAANPATAARLLVAGAGIGLAYVGLRELLALAAEARPARARRAASHGVARVLHAPALRVAIPCAALAVLAVLGVRAAATPDGPRFASAGCNGHSELCGRRLDSVAFAATHNSMAAAADPGWLFAQQEAGIPAQLAYGIRGLLIDTHYGIRTPKGVATDLEAEGTTRAKLVAEVGEPFVRAAERLRGRIGFRGEGEPGLYLCHGACEVGATPFIQSLEAIRDFAVEHPGEVIVLSIQDAITPSDTADAFRRSGLLPLVYQGPSGPPWPTLSELVESGRRIVVFGEDDTGGIPWYRPQFKLMQETPFGFRSVAELEAPASCGPNRGPAGASLFLLNNWVDTPPANKPSNARIVNARGTLLDRARRCRRERGRLPNLVAVDFYKTGDVAGVIEALNGFSK